MNFPPIQLDKFDGTYETGLDMFESLIDKNCTLSNIQKHHYQRLLSEENATKIFFSLYLIASNYGVALKTLFDQLTLQTS